VLLIHGAEDPIVPFADSCLPLLRTLSDARAHVFGHCGHASPLEYTDEFNRLVLTFLET
jgi:pimeloyl-ACP methyl ester carboxylesterase